jgi:transcriptional regulator with XRE-family HTH domain/tetratricopeptide (TPR) repeat protein
VDAGRFGPLLRDARLRAGLTQEALAERARLSWRTISDLERGVKQTPHFETVALLADALRLPEAERAAFVAAARPQGASAALTQSSPASQAVLPAVERCSLPSVPSPTPLLCRELVGREGDVQQLRAALAQATRGQPQVVMLAGEAGVGKTKLCRAFMEASRAQQALVLYGQAIAQDQALPFAPFLDALRRYFSTVFGRQALSRSAALQAHFALLLGLLPELAPLCAAVGAPTLEATSPPLHQQQALFHCVLAGLETLVQDQAGPLLLVLEDLHWADATSLDLLAFLAERLTVDAGPTEPSIPLMLLGTYRREALPESPLLTRLVGQLHAQRHASEMLIAPLSFAEHGQCLRSILAQPVPESLAQQLFEWDEGNPFFLEELLGAMAASGQLQVRQDAWHIAPAPRPSLPPSITTAILDRFVRLPAVDQEVLAYAAVIGRLFDFPLLATLCQRDEPELAAVLRRAMNAQLISEVPPIQALLTAPKDQERYQFRHALTREAIYEHLLAPDRRLRHRRVAETLERLASAAPPSGAAPATRRDNLAQLLAEHYWLAGLPDKARPYALQEAERASRLFAFREERYYLNMAQASLPEESPERFELLERIGMLSLGIFDFAEAVDRLSVAKAGYQRNGQPYRALQCLTNMLHPSWCLASPSFPAKLNELETAAEAVVAHPDHANGGVETLVITSLVANYQVSACQYRRALRWIERSMALYESLADPRKGPAIQQSLLARAYIKANQHATVAEEGIAEMRNVLKAALEYSLPDVIMLTYAWLAVMLIYWGRGDEADEVLGEAIDFESRSGLLRPYFVVGWQRYFSGERWDEGIALLRGDMQRMEQANVRAIVANSGLPLVHLLLARHELDEARRHLHHIQPIVESVDQYMFLAQLQWGLAKLQMAQGNLPQAQAYYERLLTSWKTTDDTVVILPILLDGIVLYAETGNRVQARQWLTELAAVVQVTDNPVGVAALREAQGVVHAGEGKRTQAIEELRHAVEAWGQLKRSYQQALAGQRLAQVLLAWARTDAVGRDARQAAREEADRLLNRALAVYERLQIPTGLQAVQALRSSTRWDDDRPIVVDDDAERHAHGCSPRSARIQTRAHRRPLRARGEKWTGPARNAPDSV